MLNTGIFPSKLKQSKVTPIFKAKDKELLSNYRSISVLSSVSKIFEYAIADQLTKYLIDNNITYDLQINTGFGLNILPN